jgi:hypothetical protein
VSSSGRHPKATVEPAALIVGLFEALWRLEAPAASGKNFALVACEKVAPSRSESDTTSATSTIPKFRDLGWCFPSLIRVFPGSGGLALST